MIQIPYADERRSMGKIDSGRYEALLAEAGKFHGDVCQGIQIGTRMTMCGLGRIGIDDPRGTDRKKLMVFVEIDRCATDAIMALTGCRPGKRTMKIRDYGKMAATFVNLESRKAVRVARKGSGDGEIPDYRSVADEEIFSILDVEVALRPEDLPGKPVRVCRCARCGATILDGQEVESSGEILCKPCFAGKDYYRIV
jgi:formylmethanofuran dehydrogenase subunit E